MTHHVKQQGFTLIELMLALAFTAFILIFATTAVIQVMQTYNKGLAVKQINQAGRATLEEISRNLRTADPTAVKVVSTNRRLCVDGVSYVWNLWNTTAPNKYDDGTPLTFARVSDASGAMCAPDALGNYLPPPKAQSVDILQSNVWVMAITATTPSVDAPLVDLSVSLAVANDPAISGGQCSIGGTNGQFCATSNFNTTVMTGGGN